ncbi:hypothetical protein Pmani_019353 [Petrolisthes manimaculis]|uniref:Uncharacterized protein n=1 Tax=Petrolisthes manimaculis TaxID=1843537 RepID=A0AAE1U5S1_9EUCA|nr:hypothetical protein Pmani_019353 [Petrolisthes manimaculis]
MVTIAGRYGVALEVCKGSAHALTATLSDHQAFSYLFWNSYGCQHLRVEVEYTRPSTSLGGVSHKPPSHQPPPRPLLHEVRRGRFYDA